MLILDKSPVRAELMLVDLGVEGDKEGATVPIEFGSLAAAGDCVLEFEARPFSDTVAELRLVTAAELALKDFRWLPLMSLAAGLMFRELLRLRSLTELVAECVVDEDLSLPDCDSEATGAARELLSVWLGC